MDIYILIEVLYVIFIYIFILIFWKKYRQNVIGILDNDKRKLKINEKIELIIILIIMFNAIYKIHLSLTRVHFIIFMLVLIFVVIIMGLVIYKRIPKDERSVKKRYLKRYFLKVGLLVFSYFIFIIIIELIKGKN